MNINKVTLAGNLTRDPEMQYTPKGTAVGKFGLAINRRWRDTQTQELKEEATFVDCTAFGKTAEHISQYFRKGQRIYIEGRLKLDQWEDKQTHQKRSKLNVVVETFQFVEKQADSGRAATAARPAPAARPTEDAAPSEPNLPGTDMAPAGTDDSEVPF